MLDRHAITEHTGNQLGIVPILRVELLRETLNRRLVSALVLELEVVAALSVRLNLLYNLALRHGLRQGDALLVVLQTGENLVRIAVEQTHESYPFLLVVLEAHHVALQFLRSHLHNVVQRFHRHIRSTLLLLVGLLLVLLRHGDHHSRTASVAIDGAALASRTPSLYVELVHECLVYVVRQVHGYAD